MRPTHHQDDPPAYFPGMPGVELRAAEQLMSAFAARTGLTNSGDPGRRYLWTDAFAVFALLGLFRRTGATRYTQWALRLVDLVHHVLGRYRRDDPRRGWISGLSEADGERLPTHGGLRIGKPLQERGPTEPLDEQLEWERDGQYFHYLTKWIRALIRLSAVTVTDAYNDWAIDLALAAHRAFVSPAGQRGPNRMHWKMSVDLTRPLVRSMGLLDPLDGLLTFSQLLVARPGSTHRREALEAAVADMRQMCEEIQSWSTDDALGLGELLTAASEFARLIASGANVPNGLLERLLRDAEQGLSAYVSKREGIVPPDSRLAFRELGLALGLRSLTPMRTAVSGAPDRFGGDQAAAGLLARIDSLRRHAPLRTAIERTWLAQAAQPGPGWSKDLDINTVMLATSLVPDMYLLCDCSTQGSAADHTAPAAGEAMP